MVHRSFGASFPGFVRRNLGINNVLELRNVVLPEPSASLMADVSFERARLTSIVPLTPWALPWSDVLCFGMLLRGSGDPHEPQ